MMNLVNPKLKKYCELEIIPKYQTLDLAHQTNHVFEVINKSFDIAKDYDVDANMIYAIAVYHDLGLIVNRDTHHIEGGKILSNDLFIKTFFKQSQISTMREAIEDHRASNKFPPRSIYGKIISEADRLIDPKTIVKRCFYFQFNVDDNHSFKHVYPSVKKHLNEKYGYGGYLKLWLNYGKHEEILENFRKIISDDLKIKEFCLEVYNNLD